MGIAKVLAGPAFPFQDSIRGVFDSKTREESIRTSLLIIITTPKGSIVYNPELGSEVPKLVFDIIDVATIGLIMFYVVNDIEEQDPRIRITSVNVDRKKAHSITIWVSYQDRNDPYQIEYQAPVEYVRDTI